MKKSIAVCFPVHTSFARSLFVFRPGRVLLACALLCLATPSRAAETATADTAPAVENPLAVSPGAAAFQGLIPPAGSAIVNPPHAADKSAAPAPTPTATVTYGAPKPDGEDTHPPLKLTADRAELVRLDKDAASVIVGNPENLNIQLENRKLLVLTPAKAGATYLSVLDDAGNVIMQRHVIVSSPKDNYIRIRRSCNSASSNCQQTSVYYCPGMCHAVGGSSVMPSGTASPVSSGSSAASPSAAPAGAQPAVNPSAAPEPAASSAAPPAPGPAY